MKKLLIILVLLSGCSVVSIDRSTYEGKIPQEKELSFVSKEALATGATLQNVTANKIYYEGTDPKSKDAKTLLDMSYRFLGLVGVKMNFDPSDPESVSKVFEAADKALEEKDKNLHELKIALKKAEDDRIVAEKKAGTWLSRFKTGVYSLVGFIIFVLIVLLVLQVFTGIPFLTGLITGIRTFWKVSHQTVKGIQEIRDKLKKKKEEGDDRASDLLNEIDTILDKHQDAHVKSHIQKIKNGG